MNQKIFESVLEAKTRDDLQREIAAFAGNLGFDWMSGMVVVDYEWGTKFIEIGNAEANQNFRWVAADARRDPVMQYCKYSSHPMVWDQSTYVQNGQADLWEKQAPFGYCTGINLALHLPGGRHFSLGVERAQALPKDPVELTRLVARLQLFVMQAQEVATQILLPSPTKKDEVDLTSDELEVLRWTLEGKSPWDIGEVLNISESMAVFHISNAMLRLECGTKYQASVKAQRLGLIA